MGRLNETETLIGLSMGIEGERMYDKNVACCRKVCWAACISVYRGQDGLGSPLETVFYT